MLALIVALFCNGSAERYYHVARVTFKTTKVHRDNNNVFDNILLVLNIESCIQVRGQYTASRYEHLGRLQSTVLHALEICVYVCCAFIIIYI